jgi:regulatory protein YycH of two-component signal transduction system YycFG
VVETTEPVTLKAYRYLVAQVDDKSFVSVLFAGARRAPIVAQQDSLTTYNDGVARQLKVNDESGLTTFDTYADTVGRNFGERLETGYNWLVKVRQLPDNIYYFESHDGGRDIVYRLYANGVPIFNMTNFGTVRVQQLSNSHQRISFSKYSLQVPLPTAASDEVTLPSGGDVIKELQEAGLKPSRIQRLSLGYRWVSAKDETTVTLKPEWYVEVDDTWEAVNDYMQRVSEG